MPHNNLKSSQIRDLFSKSLSSMYCLEVTFYRDFLQLIEQQNSALNFDSSVDIRRHAAIRLGLPSELKIFARLFAVMGLFAVDYYDLAAAGLPVHSTAFRPLDADEIESQPFRVFCSLLRLELIEDEETRKLAEQILQQRQLFDDAFLQLLDEAEKRQGLNQQQAEQFVEMAIKILAWSPQLSVTQQQYEQIFNAHPLLADIICFPGVHINHIAPHTEDIDALQQQLELSDLPHKLRIEGPPKRAVPILLRQTSVLAQQENITFADGQQATHSARFGEAEQRGAALTAKGRRLYDELLQKTKQTDQQSDGHYKQHLTTSFEQFPDDLASLYESGLIHVVYHAAAPNSAEKSLLLPQAIDIDQLIKQQILQIKPMLYQDFLPVSAAGIFRSNLRQDEEEQAHQAGSVEQFVAALDAPLHVSAELYQQHQMSSLESSLATLGFTDAQIENAIAGLSATE